MQICMDWRSIRFDWNQARAFLVTAEEGSLSAAARALGLTQPTLGRQVTALEETLGVTLFERTGREMTLTESGLALLEHARAMGLAATQFSLTASGRSNAIDGHVTISATHLMATFHLPPILKRLRQAAPGLEIEIVASNELSDLKRREADIAIRHARPNQADLIGKLVNETTAHLYASSAYLDRIGRPKSPEDLAGADLIGFESPDRLLPVMQDMGLPLTREDFKLSTASGPVILAMVRHGLGIGIGTRDVCDEVPDLEMVLPDLPPLPVPVWLVTHRELRTSRRIRLVFDLLAEELAKLS